MTFLYPKFILPLGAAICVAAVFQSNNAVADHNSQHVIEQLIEAGNEAALAVIEAFDLNDQETYDILAPMVDAFNGGHGELENQIEAAAQAVDEEAAEAAAAEAEANKSPEQKEAEAAEAAEAAGAAGAGAAAAAAAVAEAAAAAEATQAAHNAAVNAAEEAKKAAYAAIPDDKKLALQREAYELGLDGGVGRDWTRAMIDERVEDRRHAEAAEAAWEAAKAAREAEANKSPEQKEADAAAAAEEAAAKFAAQTPEENAADLAEMFDGIAPETFAGLPPRSFEVLGGIPPEVFAALPPEVFGFGFGLFEAEGPPEFLGDAGLAANGFQGNADQLILDNQAARGGAEAALAAANTPEAIQAPKET